MIDFLLVKLSGFILTCGMSRITAQRTNYWPLSVKKKKNSAPDKNRFILQTDQTVFVFFFLSLMKGTPIIMFSVLF